MKLLHCSDIHLGRRPVGGMGEYSSKRFEDYFAAFDWAVGTAIGKEADVVLITGDFFDKKELVPEVVRKAEEILQKLIDKKIPVILIEGNHDNITPGNEADSWLVYLETKGYFKRPKIISVLDKQFDFVELDGIKFFGTGFQGSFTNETLESLSSHLAEEGNNNNIVLVHTAISHGNGFHGTITEETARLFADKAIYVAGGHFHSFDAYPSDKPYFFLPGSLEYWDSEEFGKQKGIIIFDTETRDYEFLESPKRHALKMEFSFDVIDNDELCSQLEEHFANQPIIPGETLCHLTINLSSSFPVDSGRIESFLGTAGVLKSFVRINLPGFENPGDLNNPLLGTDQAEKEIIRGWDYFSADADATFKLLQKMKDYQQDNKQELFISEVDALLESLISKEAKNENK